MIKELFLPAKIGSHRIYSQKILSFSIQNNTVTCVQIHAKRNKTIIQNIFHQKVNSDNLKNISQETTLSIKNILSQIKTKYDLIKISIPSSQVVFKELIVPFKNNNKIRMILDYEIESMLPFSINEAITDFIVTNQNLKHKNSTQILTAAIRQNDLKQILKIYENTGISPTNITVDLFAIYSLYQQIDEYKNIPGHCAIIDLGLDTTKVAFLQNGALRLIRTIPKGIKTIAKEIANNTSQTEIQILDDLIKLGIENKSNDKYDKSLKKNIFSFLNDIQFTINSFASKLDIENKLNKILITGQFSNITNLTTFCSDLLKTSCELFVSEKILNNKQLQNKTNKPLTDWNNYSVALGTALTSKEQNNFDLRRKIFTIKNIDLIKKQIITALTISTIMIITIFVIGYLQVGSLSQKISKLEKRETSRLRRLFPKNINLSKQIKFTALIRKAEDLIESKQEMWAAFDKEKLNPLILLQEITNIIDKRRFDVTIDTIYISQENGIPKLEVNGIFKAKAGNKHFKYFAELEKRFEQSKFLELEEEIDFRQEEDKGIKFSSKLKLKEI